MAVESPLVEKYTPASRAYFLIYSEVSMCDMLGHTSLLKGGTTTGPTAPGGLGPRKQHRMALADVILNRIPTIIRQLYAALVEFADSDQE